jgi:DNA-binding MarR family transcriptional regulator
MSAAQLDLQIMGHLNERQKRLYGATQALKYGYGGIKKIHEELGLDTKTIRRGMQDLQEAPLTHRVRVVGGGRKKIIAINPEIPEVLKGIIKERGNPMKHLLYTHLSIDKLTEAVREKGYTLGKNVVNRMLWNLGFSLKGNKKNLHKKSHKDRDKQFTYIDRLVDGFLVSLNIVISIDAKKTEKVGNYANPGKTYQQKGEATLVEDHDFGKKDKRGKIIKAIPFGIYEIKRNKGHINVGTDHNTAEFAVESVRRWYNKEGKLFYSKAKHIMITADSGGANGNRVKQWKWELQKLANETGLTIHICHYPSGTSKWNKIEHRLFSFISRNWQGVPLQSYEIILGLIGRTTTKAGLTVSAELDTGTYELGKKPTKEEMASMKIKPHRFHPEWNYSIYPNS